MEHPFILILKIISIVIFCYALVTATRKPLIGILKRDDEIPVILTVTSVLAASGAALYLNIPEAVPLVVLGSALSKTNPIILERITTPFKDVFLAFLFIFFGVSIQMSGSISLVLIAVISLLAIGSKVFSGLIVGKLLHNSFASGLEIGDYTIPRGEFAVILAAIYGSAVVSTTVAAVVVITSIFGSFTSRFSGNIHKWVTEK
jgi:CPA2 family monovalent cation:H+ antiporter-2